ncbi:MAG TPA: hypothetical protein VGE21_13290 [Flavobacteriales bacterium]
MLKKTLLISLSVVAALFVVLVVHIALVTGKPKDHKADLQLARIDLQEPVDSAQASLLKSEVLSLPGVDHCYLNMDAGTLVYSYARAQQNRTAVLEHVIAVSPVPVTAFEVSVADAAGSCPVIRQGSVQDRFSRWVQDLVH